MAPSEPRPGGRDCELFNDNIFTLLRVKAEVRNDFIDEGWSLADLSDGGGKGGALMAKVGKGFIVKELSKADHVCLLQVAASYAAHCVMGETLLCPIYLHFRDRVTGRYFFVMRNVLGTGPFNVLYDLKGCADDKVLEEDGVAVKAVHKRIWNIGMWVSKSSWSEDRHLYHTGKMKARQCTVDLPEEHRVFILKTMYRDTAWLLENNLMDYSLLVAMKELSPQDYEGETLGHRPLLHRTNDGREIAVYVSIIDYLQKWTTSKVLARYVKVLESDKATVPPETYANRFNANFVTKLRKSSECTALSSTSTVGLKESSMDFLQSSTTVGSGPVLSCVSGEDTVAEEESEESPSSSDSCSDPCVVKMYSVEGGMLFAK